MKKFNLWMLAAILTICGAVTLTSCVSNDDIPAPDLVVDDNPLAEYLEGWWLVDYDEAGAFPGLMDDDPERPYSQVMQAFHFNADGTGVWEKFFFDEYGSPVRCMGDLAYLDQTKSHCYFRYTSTKEGDVHVTLVNYDDWMAEYAAREMDLHYTSDGLTLNDGDTQRTLVLSDYSEIKAYVAYLHVAGEGDDNPYGEAAKPYKPAVDHSKWMAPLADDRLVCDLSLPGTHDACTAEGWHLAKELAELTSKTQDLTIDEQLKVGVRVFDLRPERVLSTTNATYDLRCCHGVIQTELLVKDFFLKMRDFLKENPTEFCIVTSSVNATLDKNAWAEQFSALINGSDLSGLFADFKPNITVGDLRGRVLLLSRDDCEGMTAGGFLKGWSSNKDFSKQQNGTIKGTDGNSTPLWTQDYYDVGKDLTGKDEAIRRMLDATAARDLTSANPAWVFNYSAGYVGLVSSDHYRENAARTNRLVIDYLNNPLHNASAGIVMMDYAGMDKTPGYNSSTVYESCGLQLVEALIDQNFRTPGTIDASLFSVCTLNVDGLPALPHINDDGPGTKFTPVISRYLADKNFDFIGVQENFNFDKELGRSLTANYDHDSWAGGMTIDNLFNDHVHVAVFQTDGCKAWWHSHLKTVRTDSIRWNDRYGYADHCLDEAATKGFRRYEITTTDGYQLVVYNMHMEASERWDEVGGTDDEDRACRLKQWIQLREHIFSKLDTRPVLVIGDFNTYYCRDDMKANFIDAINASGRATCGDAWIEKCRGGVYPALEEDKKIKDDGDWLGWTIRGEMPDKILYINPVGGHSVELLSCTYDNADVSRDYFKPSGYAKDHEEPLGDHFPLFATIRLK